MIVLERAVHSAYFNEDRESLGVRVLTIPDFAATSALGAALADVLPPTGGLLVTLDGDLGAGKTTLVRAMLRALGYDGPVKSPTYALVELYKLSSLCLYHFDLYRFTGSEEFIDAGLAEYFLEDAICCVEWPEKATGVLPPVDLAIHIEMLDAPACVDVDGEGAGRRVSLCAKSPRGEACLAQLILPPSISVGAR